jgi:hypothetical protein
VGFFNYKKVRKTKFPPEFVPEKSRLTFIKITTIENKNNERRVRTMALYKCSCGNEKEMNLSKVKGGFILSCGCIGKEKTIERSFKHGKCKHPLYTTWRCVISRCYYTKADGYESYGEKGVRVCDEWRNSFVAFYDWAIANGWQKGMQIDKDIKAKTMGVPALLYSPEFCSVVTYEENNADRKGRYKIEWRGRVQNASDWEKEMNFPKSTLHNRIKNQGMSIEEAFTKPIVTRPPRRKLGS